MQIENEKNKLNVLDAEKLLDGPKIKLTDLHIVTMWTWVLGVDNCAICRNHIMDLCITCQSDPGTPSECDIAYGECDHSFHFHCIVKWLKFRITCPFDNKEFIFRSSEKPKNLYKDVKSLTLLIPVHHPAPYFENFQNLMNIKSNSNESLYTIKINTHNFQIFNEFISIRAPSLNLLM